MTVHDDLATLLDPKKLDWAKKAAASRVEAEIARLGNALAQERARPEGSFDQWARLQAAEAEVARLERLADDRLALMKAEEQGWQQECDELKARAEAAEAEIARLNEALETPRQYDTLLGEWKDRTEAAEAEVARLRDELERHKEMESVAGAREFGITQERNRLRDGLRDAGVVIEKMANGANRKDVEPEFSRFRALLADQDGAAKRVYPVKDWLRGTGDMVWCPGCAFGFGEEHVTEATGQWDCPNCGAQSRDGAACCPCGHSASEHPVVWLVAGDATTACRVDGCGCLDYDGPPTEDGAA